MDNANTEHSDAVTVTWTGNAGLGSADHFAYRRDPEVAATGRPVRAPVTKPR